MLEQYHQLAKYKSATSIDQILQEPANLCFSLMTRLKANTLNNVASCPTRVT